MANAVVTARADVQLTTGGELGVAVALPAHDAADLVRAPNSKSH
jgi:hypothetical protein